MHRQAENMVRMVAEVTNHHIQMRETLELRDARLSGMAAALEELKESLGEKDSELRAAKEERLKGSLELRDPGRRRAPGSLELRDPGGRRAPARAPRSWRTPRARLAPGVSLRERRLPCFVQKI
jgi:hypothetical protein